MLQRINGMMGLLVAVVLVMLALWGWGEADNWVRRAEEPKVALWAVRSLAIAAFAAAQVLGVTLVAGLFDTRRGKVSDWLGAGAGLICTVALICAIALGMVSR